MFVTMAIDADSIVASVEVADDAEIYWLVLVTLIFPKVLSTIEGAAINVLLIDAVVNLAAYLIASVV
jgi:hypothetical protein